MKRFRKMSALAMTLVLVAGLFGCGGTSSGTASTAESTSSKSEVSQTGSTGEPWIISCSSTAPNTTDNTVGYVVAANVLNEKLMELSGGTMGFELILGGVYGSTAQHFAQLKAGTLDTFISGFDVATNLDGTEDFAAVAMPFVFDDDEHMDKFLESGLWAEMTETMRENNGIMYAGLYLHQPPRILTSRTEVVHPEDVKGMKIRVPESQVQIDVWTAAGANPMQVAATELYSALDTGVVDAQENDLVGSTSLKIYEVNPYYTEIDYIRQCMMVYMSEKTWDKMTEEQRGWWNEALAEACDAGSEAYLTKYDAAKQEVLDNGGTIVEFDYDEWKEFFTDIVMNQFDGTLFREGLYTEIQNMNK